MPRPIDGFPRAAARALAAGLVLAACADAPTGPLARTPASAAAALLSGAATDGPVLVSNAVKYRDAGYHPATGRAGSATLSVRALLGADGTAEVEAAPGALDSAAAPAGTVARVQVKAWDGAEALFTRGYAVDGAVFRAGYPGLLRGTRVQVQALVRGVDGRRTDVVTAETPVLLRPDLAVSLIAPPEVEAGTAAPVVATVAEANGDVGARADCVLYVDGVAADRAEGIWVDAGDAVACRFSPRLDAPGTRRLEVRLENVAPGDFDPANNAGWTSVRVLRSEQIFYSASAEDRTYTSHTLRRRTYRENTPDTYDWVRTDDEAGRVQASVLYGSLPTRPGLPFSADVWQETGGVVVHAGSYALTAACVQHWDTDAGVRFALCAPSGAGGGATVEYERHTGTVTYHSAETLYRRLSGGGQWQLVYSWSSNRVEQTGTLADFGADFTFHVAIRDGSGVWRASPAIAMVPFTGTEGHDFCRMYPNPWNQWETYCEVFTRTASGVRGSATLQP
jgi:hypothetical protein